MESFLDRETATQLQTRFSGLGSGHESHPLHDGMPLTEGARSALSAAFEHAQGAAVTPLHLLWGMFADENSQVAGSLLEHGVTRHAIESAIRKRSSG